MDANSKLGPEVLENDHHNQSQNGQILLNIIKRHILINVNGLKEKCIGLVTRQRVTKVSAQESVIDSVLISADLEENLQILVIDEKRLQVLMKYVKNKGRLKKSGSDHAHHKV